MRTARTTTLDIAYEEHGAADGTPVFLMHGWPYDARCHDEMVPALAAAGCRVIVPYLRGFGPTRFLFADTPRSGQQAALGDDLRELMDALGIARAVLAGFDWGGRAACVVAALWGERVRALVTAPSTTSAAVPIKNRFMSEILQPDGAGDLKGWVSEPKPSWPWLFASRRWLDPWFGPFHVRFPNHAKSDLPNHAKSDH